MMDGMFGFLDMVGNYESRCVANYNKNDIFVDTALVTDAGKPYETAIKHPLYNNGDMIIVEYYDTKEDAQIGHDRWVKLLVSEDLPLQIKDISTACIVKLFSRGNMIYGKQVESNL